MKINLKEVSVFLSAILLAGSYAVAQNPYRWTDELELWVLALTDELRTSAPLPL